MKAKWVSRDAGCPDYLCVWENPPERRGKVFHGKGRYEVVATDRMRFLGFRVPAEGTCIPLERVEE